MPSFPALAFLVIGIMLLVFGFLSADSITSSFSKFFTGHPSDRSMWLIIGGLLCLCIGLGTGYFGRRTR
jgi:amino acid permease